MRRLQLIETADEEEPVPEIGGSLLVAFATQDLHQVDAHFGSARKLAIYEIGPDDYRFVEAMEFDSVSEETGEHADDGDDRLGAKIEALKGCAMLFVLAIGGAAAARVVNSRIHPVKVPRPEAITDVIDRIQTMLRGTPPPWMRKLVRRDTGKPADFLDEEDQP
jgi:nitrogen fixation protein NifX